MKALTLLPPNSSVSDILDFIRSTIGYSHATIEKELPQILEDQLESRYKKVKFDVAEVTFIFNLFNICDICLIEFKDLKKSTECYELCNERFTSTDTHLWFDNDTLIQFYTNQKGSRGFRFCLKPLSIEEQVSAV